MQDRIENAFDEINEKIDTLRKRELASECDETEDSKSKFIISEPTLLEEPGFELAFLPYIPESRKQEVTDYFTEKKGRRLLISHNDLFGIQMGPAVSAVGFKPADLASVADFVVNGHLHNGQWVIRDKVLNLGNLTGKDFGEDAYTYEHHILILDTDTLEI